METWQWIILLILIIVGAYFNLKFGVCRRCGKLSEIKELDIDEEYYEKTGFFDSEVVFLKCIDDKQCLENQKKKSDRHE